MKIQLRVLLLYITYQYSRGRFQFGHLKIYYLSWLAKKTGSIIICHHPEKGPSGGLTTQIASVHMALPAGRNLAFNIKKAV
jgi:hypothetical protein